MSSEEEKIEEALKLDESREGEEETKEENPFEEKGKEAPEPEQTEEKTGKEEPQKFTVMVDGEEREVTVEELKKSYSYHGHNVKTAQENARERAKLKSEWEALKKQREKLQYREPDEDLDNLGKLDLNDPMLSPAVKTLARKVQRYERKLAEIEGKTSAIEMRSVEEEIDRTINQFKNRYPQVSDEELASAINRLLDKDVPLSMDTLSWAYKDSIDIDAIKQKAIDEYRRKKKEDSRKALVEPSGSSSGSDDLDITNMSEQEIDRRMAKIFGG